MAEDAESKDRDAFLLSRVALGDAAAMRALYLTHAEAVQRFLRPRLNDRSSVQDILHETMLDIWRQAGRFEGRASVRSWMLTMARNKAVDHMRKQSRVTLAEVDETLPDDEPDALAVLAAAEDARRIRQCLDKLSVEHRAAVYLAFYEDLSYRDIAAVEKAPEGTIKTRIFHAKKLLMRCLAGMKPG